MKTYLKQILPSMLSCKLVISQEQTTIKGANMYKVAAA